MEFSFKWISFEQLDMLGLLNVGLWNTHISIVSTGVIHNRKQIRVNLDNLKVIIYCSSQTVAFNSAFNSIQFTAPIKFIVKRILNLSTPNVIRKRYSSKSIFFLSISFYFCIRHFYYINYIELFKKNKKKRIF